LKKAELEQGSNICPTEFCNKNLKKEFFA